MMLVMEEDADVQREGPSWSEVIGLAKASDRVGKRGGKRSDAHNGCLYSWQCSNVEAEYYIGARRKE